MSTNSALWTSERQGVDHEDGGAARAHGPQPVPAVPTPRAKYSRHKCRSFSQDIKMISDKLWEKKGSLSVTDQ